MTTDAEGALRENLKVALQHAKQLYDDGLVDEREFKDLKAHELSKYKEHLGALTASVISRTVERTPPDTKRIKSDDVTPISSPMNTRMCPDASRTSPPSAPSSASPRRRPKSKDDQLIYVDSNTLKRLTTPPIFRRRSAKKRKIVIPRGQLQGLENLQEEKTGKS